jgi:hypothetical protein
MNSKSNIFIFFVLCVVFAALIACKNKEDGNKKEFTGEVWMNPFTVPNSNPTQFSKETWKLPDLTNWAKTQKGLDVICVFIGAIDNFSAATDAQIKDFCKMLEQTGIKLAIELCGLCNWYQNTYKPESYNFAYQSVYGEFGEFTKISKLIKALQKRGLTIDYLNFDHAILRAMNPSYENASPKMSLREAAEQLYLCMAMWKKECAGIKFNYVVNFPNHGWKSGIPVTGSQWPKFSDYFYGDFYDDFKEICRLNKISDIKMNAIIVDFPYNLYLNSDMALSKTEKLERIKDLEKETKDAGMKYGIIFNSEKEGNGLTGDHNRDYYNAVLEYIKYYTSNGGDPDYYINESWYQYPDKLLPEDEPFTLTNLTLEIIKRVK